MAKILLVEDDTIIASGLIYALEQEGYSVRHCERVKTALLKIKEQQFDLAVLDMQLPDGTGFDINEHLKGTDTAVIFLTIVDDEGNIVRAFDNGAADYVTKPFRLRELLARVRHTLEVSGGRKEELMLSIGNVSIEKSAGRVCIGEEQIELTALEYRLLLIFANHKGELLTRAKILENIWDVDGNFVEDNTLTVYIKRLREKLGDAIHIQTVRGMGYRAD